MTRCPLPEPGGVRSGRRFVPSGFTLLEMLLVVTIIAIIAGTLVPIITRPQTVERHFETVKEMAGIVDAVMGRPDLGMPGFVDVMGRLPTPLPVNGTNMGVDELYTPPSNPYTARAPSWGGATSGWNGPFLRTYQPDPDRDAWGNFYQFTLNPLNAGDWRITSFGPDRLLGTADDVVLPDSNGYFSTMAKVTVDLFLQLQGTMARLPNSALVTADATGTTVSQAAVPIIWLPSTLDGSMLQCTGIPGSVSPGGCPGSCYVVDAGGTAVAAAGGAGLTPPYSVACSGSTAGSVGIPFGLHHVQIAAAPTATGIQDATLNLGQVDFNVLVTQGYSTVRVPLRSTGIPGGATPGNGQWLPSALSSTASTQVRTILTGSGRTTPTTAVTNLDLRFQGTLSVTAGSQCDLKVVVPGGASPIPPYVPYPSPFYTAASSTVPVSGNPSNANVPFDIDVLVQIPASPTGYDLTQLKLTMNLHGVGGTCSVLAGTPISGSGSVANVSGMIMRAYEP